MLLSDLELLHHILEEIHFILDNYSGRTENEVVNDPVLSRAVIRSLEIIGEASKKISLATKGNHPDIEWKKMAGTRDKLIHDYFGVDYDIVVDIIKNKLPDLKDQIEIILKK